jgi:transposase
MIEYKCKLEGIEVILINEAHTSKCSVLDFEEISKKDVYVGNRVKRGLFKTKEGLLINADINASINILRKVSTNGDLDVTNVVGDLQVSPVRLNIKDNLIYLTKSIK